jgi:hypothetical protein
VTHRRVARDPEAFSCGLMEKRGAAGELVTAHLMAGRGGKGDGVGGGMVTLPLTCCGIHMSGLFGAEFVVIVRVLYYKNKYVLRLDSCFIQYLVPLAVFVELQISNPDPPYFSRPKKE